MISSYFFQKDCSLEVLGGKIWDNLSCNNLKKKMFSSFWDLKKKNQATIWSLDLLKKNEYFQYLSTLDYMQYYQASLVIVFLRGNAEILSLSYETGVASEIIFCTAWSKNSSGLLYHQSITHC